MSERNTPTRREALQSAASGLGALALTTLLAEQAQADARKTNPLAPRTLHHPARAKSVIYLYMEGGPSQIDTFDPKPRLDRDHGKPLPIDTPRTVFNIGNKIMRSPFKFAQHGQSGAWVSELFPHLARCVDDMTIIRSMHHGISNHSSACYMSHSGYPMAGKPSMGAWVTYGLGSVGDDLPGFVVLDCGQGPSGGSPTWGSGFLPAAYQGTLFTKNAEPIDHLKRREATADRQRRKFDAIQKLNGVAARRSGDNRLDALVASYERAFAMQASVPELTDLSGESRATRSLYGLDSPNAQTALFGSRCLLARRMVERGVRFIEVFPPRVSADRWDQHGNLEKGHRLNAAAVDQPIAALLHDLKTRGLLDETIVLWGGEFGRTPNQQGSNGRDHNPFGYTVWCAGGGFKPGIRHGTTDEFGYYAQNKKVHLHDLHATMLHQLGVDHERLTYRFSGRDFRLTDVHGHVLGEVLEG